MHSKRLRKQSAKDLVRTDEKCPYEYRGSPIHGLGVFCKKSLPKGYVLGKYMILKRKIGDPLPENYSDDYLNYNIIHRDELCRFMNHKIKSNVYIDFDKDGKIVAILKRDISPEEELVLNYLDVMKFLDKNFFPYVVGHPVIIRTKELVNFGSKQKGDALDDAKKIEDGEWD